jgi:hypothetical protein
MLLNKPSDSYNKVPIKITFGQSQIEKLKQDKTIIVRALTEGWINQMFLSAPHLGRRLWFEVVSFVKPGPIPKSTFFSLQEQESRESFYTVDIYNVDTILTYSDYIYLLDSLADTLEEQGYTVNRHIIGQKEFEIGLSEIIGRGVASQYELVERFAETLKQDKHLLDEVPYSILSPTFTIN